MGRAIVGRRTRRTRTASSPRPGGRTDDTSRSVTPRSGSSRYSRRVSVNPDLVAGLLAVTEARRVEVARSLPPEARARLGQFFTPLGVAEIMANLVDVKRPVIRLLDPGAGIGSLVAGLVARILTEAPDVSLDVTAVEVDPVLLDPLLKTLTHCESVGKGRVTFQVVGEDFISWATGASRLSSLGYKNEDSFNTVLMNPPYRKIARSSYERAQLAGAGIETTNLYTAFIALAQNLLIPFGQMVAITPRSFCNGTYFRGFRKRFLDEMSLRAIHVFESRATAFAGDRVLQENVIFAADKSRGNSTVVLASSEGHGEDLIAVREVPAAEVVRPDDPESFIRIILDDAAADIAQRMWLLPGRLPDLGLTVSTGRVVDFRAREYLHSEVVPGSVPLIYQGHLQRGRVEWPSHRLRKPQSISVTSENQELFFPRGHYALTKRFTSKEEPRRVVAATFDPDEVPGGVAAFENHVNVFHGQGSGIPRLLAQGLCGFLNSSLVDNFFRQFSGHTQVNSGDLRALPYPTRDQLEDLGAALPKVLPEQQALDILVQRHIPALAYNGGEDQLSAQRKIDEALSVLKQLELPRSQQNERSALTLLALSGLRPESTWADATAPLCGITPMMTFFSEHYGKTYAPNTRETVRRQTVHQFLAAALIVQNPDRPDRPVNSPKATYQIEQSALLLLQAFGTPQWARRLSEYMASRESLITRWAAERNMHRIPVLLPNGSQLALSAGGQNVLIKELVEGFCSRFTPGGQVLYIGDADAKWAFHDEATLRDLGVEVAIHGKMPDLVIFYPDRNWLILVEAVTSHGPVDGKRHAELRKLFSGSSAGLVFVTAFLERHTMARYLTDISWETEVWCADSPSHLIHFNGSRFLGPYQ